MGVAAGEVDVFYLLSVVRNTRTPLSEYRADPE